MEEVYWEKGKAVCMCSGTFPFKPQYWDTFFRGLGTIVLFLKSNYLYYIFLSQNISYYVFIESASPQSF